MPQSFVEGFEVYFFPKLFDKLSGTFIVIVFEDWAYFEIALEECGEEINDIPRYVIVEYKEKLEYDDIYCWGRNSDVAPHWDGVKECLKLTFYNKHDERCHQKNILNFVQP